MREYGEVLEWVDLKKYNTYGIGGKAKYLIKPFKDKVGDLLNYLDNSNINWYILGKGSNVILPDNDFDGAIISLENLNEIVIKDDVCSVGSGVLLSNLVNKSLDNGFVNLAPLMGIPGALGAAILGNVGAYGKEIFDFVKDVTFIDESNKVVTLPKEKIDHRYRYTEFKNKKVIILGATLLLEKGNVEEARNIIKENLLKRKNSQPLEFRNAGSVFKNPDGAAAGKLIDDAGLKETTVGGAMVSAKHANFIVNFNNAQSSDIIGLINLIKKEIKKIYNIDLELEQIIVNW